MTRAWRLVKFIDNGMLTMTRCNNCGGHFVTHPHEIARHFTCGLCNPPARAGKGKAAGSIRIPSSKGEVAACIAEAALDAPLDAGIEAPQAGAAPAAARGPRKAARRPAGETRLH